MTLTDFDYALLVFVGLVIVFQLAAWIQRRNAVSAQPPNVTFVNPTSTMTMPEPVKTQIDGLTITLGKHDDWLKQIDHDLKGVRTSMQMLPNKNELPSKDLVHRMEIQMAEMKGQIAATDATVVGMSRQVERIADHLLNSKD